MLRKLMIILTMCVLLPAAALGDMDNSVLTSVENAQIWMANDTDVVIRTQAMPFTSTTSNEDW